MQMDTKVLRKLTNAEKPDSTQAAKDDPICSNKLGIFSGEVENLSQVGLLLQSIFTKSKVGKAKLIFLLVKNLRKTNPNKVNQMSTTQGVEVNTHHLEVTTKLLAQQII